jgi:hypothetical protein
VSDRQAPRLAAHATAVVGVDGVRFDRRAKQPSADLQGVCVALSGCRVVPVGIDRSTRALYEQFANGAHVYVVGLLGLSCVPLGAEECTALSSQRYGAIRGVDQLDGPLFVQAPSTRFQYGRDKHYTEQCTPHNSVRHVYLVQ